MRTNTDGGAAALKAVVRRGHAVATIVLALFQACAGAQPQAHADQTPPPRVVPPAQSPTGSAPPTSPGVRATDPCEACGPGQQCSGGQCVTARAIALSHGVNDCALLSNGALVCWGRSPGPQAATEPIEPTPILISSGLSGTTLSGDSDCFYAPRGAEAQIKCFGPGWLYEFPVFRNLIESGRCKDVSECSHNLGFCCSSTLPATAMDLGMERVQSFTGRIDSGCAVIDGRLRHWGNPSSWGMSCDDETARGLGVVAEIRWGVSHGCLRTQNGEVWCVGRGDYGMLGNGVARDSKTWVKVKGISDAKQVAVGLRFSCALRSSGEVFCWGGQEDDWEGTQPLRLTPVKIRGVEGARAISATQMSACVIGSSDEVICWGGRQGVHPEHSPRGVPEAHVVAEFGKVKTMVHGCVLRADDSVRCWAEKISDEEPDFVDIDFAKTITWDCPNPC